MTHTNIHKYIHFILSGRTAKLLATEKKTFFHKKEKNTKKYKQKRSGGGIGFPDLNGRTILNTFSVCHPLPQSRVIL